MRAFSVALKSFSRHTSDTSASWKAIDAHLLVIGAKLPEPNAFEHGVDGDLLDFLQPSLPKLELHMLPEDIDFGVTAGVSSPN